MPENATELLERPAAEVVGADAGEIGDVEAGDVEQGEIIAADLLVEEISIDGMCGVY